MMVLFGGVGVAITTDRNPISNRMADFMIKSLGIRLFENLCISIPENLNRCLTTVIVTVE